MNLVKLQYIKLIHRSPLHSYTLAMKNQRNQENNPTYHCNEKIKIPGINILRETKEQYAENYKTLINKSKMTQTDGEIYHVLGLEESIL